MWVVAGGNLVVVVVVCQPVARVPLLAQPALVNAPKTDYAISYFFVVSFYG